MKNNKANINIPIPYLFLTVTIIPIFIILLYFPATPKSVLHLKISNFMDSYLLGQVGYWSSNFPFSSKLVANYISILGPIFSLIFFAKTYLGLVMDPEQYKSHTIGKFIFTATVILSFISFIVFINYFDSVDLGMHDGRWRYLGANTLTYGIFSSGLLFVYYGMTLFSYASLVYMPRILLKRLRKK